MSPANLTRRRVESIHERASSAGGFLPDVVRRIRADAPPLSQADQQFLSDLVRPDRRYGLSYLVRLLDIAARCETVEGRYALVQALTKEIEARCDQPALPLEVAMLAEDRAQHENDDAVRRYTLTSAPTDLDRVMESAHAHAITLANLHASAAAAADRGDA